MIIDSHDGEVATVRMTSEEARVLQTALAGATYVVRRNINLACPNVDLGYLETMVNRVATRKTS